MFEDFDYLKKSLNSELVGGFNVNVKQTEIEVEVFRTDFLNAPLQIKNAMFSLRLKKKYYDADGFYLKYALYSDELN